MLASEQVLCHYNPDFSIKLACDASLYGIGCVLSHTFSEGSERPIAFASRTFYLLGYAKIQYLPFRKYFKLITNFTWYLQPIETLPAMTAAQR